MPFSVAVQSQKLHCINQVKFGAWITNQLENKISYSSKFQDSSLEDSKLVYKVGDA